jgi:hypothetical protein
MIPRQPRIEFGDEFKKPSSVRHTPQHGFIVRYVLKIPGIATATQAQLVLLIVSIVCVLLTILLILSPFEKSYYIPPEAFQDQMLNE